MNAVLAVSDLMTTTTYVLANSFFMLGTLLVVAVNIVGMWMLFMKAGHPGWYCLLPFYSMWLLYEMAFGDGKGWIFILSGIPCVGLIVVIIMLIKLAQAFGKGIGFGIGLVFLQPIFILILAFGDADYYGAY